MKSRQINRAQVLDTFASPAFWIRLLLAGIIFQGTMLAGAAQDQIDPQTRIKDLQTELSANPELNLNAALFEATRLKLPSVVRWLLEQGASPNASDFITGDSLLHVTVGNNDLGSTLELLRFGGRVDSENSEGKTPIELTTNKTIQEVLVYFRDHPAPRIKPATQGTTRSESSPDTSRPEKSEPTGAKFENSLAMKFQRIESGTFRMGSGDSVNSLSNLYRVDPKYFRGELPARRVKISKPYYLGAHEVTVGQFADFVNQASYRTDGERTNQGELIKVVQSKLVRQSGGTWRNPGFKQEPTHPVVNVSWNDANAFCKWLSKKEGRAYRLPTEAEWEYAGRAGTTSRFSTGDQKSSLRGFANVIDLSYRKTFPGPTSPFPFEDGFVFTAPVGSFRANKFGLHDMHGNVWEWCSDWYDENYYQRGINIDPPGPSRGQRKVIRGGCWY